MIHLLLPCVAKVASPFEIFFIATNIKYRVLSCLRCSQESFGYGLDDSRFDPRQKQELILIFKHSRLALGPTQHHIKRTEEPLPLVKAARSWRRFISIYTWHQEWVALYLYSLYMSLGVDRKNFTYFTFYGVCYKTAPFNDLICISET